MPTEGRIEMIVDPDTWQEHDRNLESGDPLGFRVDTKKYVDQIKGAARKVGAGDAYRAGTAAIGGIPVEAGFFVFEFMGGSMGSVVGEKITRQFERAVASKRPAILFSASGGARMQEGVLSLMQMAKTSAARSKLREARVPYIAVLLHPTTGGVAASVAMLGDLTIAEPDALIGFAGPRVIEQTIRQQLPAGFQRSEFLLEHGMVDLVVSRKDLKPTLERALRWFMRGRDANRRTGLVGDVELEIPATD
jgi:acetyl-CoA carboxylase carboxyl transferase subunit beta